jgi:methionyl-tRNA formyltransferase
MEPKPDTGRIIAVKRFALYEHDTVHSLTQRCYEHILVLFYEVVEKIFADEHIFTSNEEWTREPFTRKELDELCVITKDMSEEEVKRRKRATTYP